jgi:hypothetical protein
VINVLFLIQSCDRYFRLLSGLEELYNPRCENHFLAGLERGVQVETKITDLRLKYCATEQNEQSVFHEVLFGNNKGRTISDPAFALLELNIDLVFKHLSEV